MLGSHDFKSYFIVTQTFLRLGEDGVMLMPVYLRGFDSRVENFMSSIRLGIIL